MLVFSLNVWVGGRHRSKGAYWGRCGWSMLSPSCPWNTYVESFSKWFLCGFRIRGEICAIDTAQI